MVFGEGLDMRAWTAAIASTDGRFLIGYAAYGSARNDLYVKDLREGGDWTPIVEGLDCQSYGTAIGSDFYMLTTHEAPNGRILLVDLEHPEPAAWTEIIPEGEHSISSFLYAGEFLVVGYLENAHERVIVFRPDGTFVREIELPDMASIGDWTSDWRRSDFFMNLNSFLMPPTIVRSDLSTGLSSTHMAVEAPIDVEPYVTHQAWYPSRDGTMISMFLVHRRDIVLDGTNPTILNGYGGFDVSMTPEFARNRYLWFEHGGIYAVPNLRGGGEYGEAWHRAGMGLRKQNTFDDFIAAAEWLIEEGYTSPSKLAVWGGSNGGLLVAAFVTQRPELAAAAIADVPLTDMTRFHLLYGGSIWTPEYGSPEDPDHFGNLYMYSPYHTIVEGTEYPAVYITTAETDTRVHPSHALKMVARLQDATSSGKPVLLRYERQAGHGMAPRMSGLLEEYVDYYSFLFRELGVEWSDRRP
jgi:prolyl oligopeptidase